MNLIDLTVKDFLKEVDSDKPAPGGGSVAALTSSLGVSLGRMVAHLSFGKKKFEANSDVDKENFKNAFDELLKLKIELDDLVDRDTQAYNTVMFAYKLPKETEEQKKDRNDAIQKALKVAIQTPYEITLLSSKAINLMKIILKFGNKNAISDIGVGTLLLLTGLESGILNVKINLSSIEDSEYVSIMNEELQKLKERALEEKEEIMEIVNNNI